MNIQNIFTIFLGAINKNRALIQTHIGNNPYAHTIANYTQHGFLSRQDKMMYDGRARFISTPTSIFDLDEGLYASAGNFLDKPSEVDESYSIVRVIGSGENGQKIITYYWINARKTYTAYKSYGDERPVWFNPMYIQVTMLGGNTATTNELFVDKTGHANVVNIHLAGPLQLTNGGYTSVANLGAGRLFPKKTISFAVAATNTTGGFCTVNLQITSNGVINIINSSGTSIKAFDANVTYYLKSEASRAVESL